MSKAWSGGSTRRWREKIRPVVMARDHNRCQLKVPGICTGVATCVHHTLGRKRTGDDPRYLVASCDACNQHIGDPTTHTDCDLCTQLQPDPEPTPRTRW